MTAILLLATIAAAPAQPIAADSRYPGYTLVLFIDSRKPEQLALLPDLRKAYELGYPLRYGFTNAGNNPEYLAYWGLTDTPIYIMHRGHRALESSTQPHDLPLIQAWFRRQQGEGDLGDQDEPKPATHQQRLKPDDRRYLRWQLSPGSCGMLGCTAHGGGARLMPW